MDDARRCSFLLATYQSKFASRKKTIRLEQKRANIKFHTCTSNVKYFFIFLTIITKYGNLIPNVFLGSNGHEMNVVLKFFNKTKNFENIINLEMTVNKIAHVYNL